MASYQEQKNTFAIAGSLIDQYVDPGRRRPKKLILCGGPGVGKTFVSQLTTLYCLCRGLNGLPTALVADRARELGGMHIHRLFSLRVNNASPGRTAERAIRELYRKPELLHFLQSLDFLNIDEWGVLSAELIASIDLVLRYVRGSSEFMGGIFIIATMDHLQLQSFKGSPSMLSLYVLTEFVFVELKESVRASKDPALREICNLTRKPMLTKADEARFEDLLTKHANFVKTFQSDDIPAEAVFVFARKMPCQEAENLMIDRAKRIYQGQYVVSQCIDEESTLSLIHI